MVFVCLCLTSLSRIISRSIRVALPQLLNGCIDATFLTGGAGSSIKPLIWYQSLVLQLPWVSSQGTHEPWEKERTAIVAASFFPEAGKNYMPWPQGFCASDEKTRPQIPELSPAAQAPVGFHLSSCQGVASRAWAADKMSTMLTWRGEGSLHPPRASTFWYNIGGHWAEKGHSSLSRPRGPVRWLSVPALRAAWGVELEAGVPSASYRGPYRGQLVSIPCSNSWSLFHVPSLSCSNGHLRSRFGIWPPSKISTSTCKVNLVPKGNNWTNPRCQRSKWLQNSLEGGSRPRGSSSL